MRRYRKGSFLFSLLMLVLVVAFFLTSLSYDQKDRLVPLVVLTPAVAMAAFAVAGELFPVLLRRSNTNVISLGQNDEQAESPAEVSDQVSRRRLFIVGGWLLGFCFLSLLVGFSIAIPVAVFLILKCFLGYGWLKSLIIAAVIWGFIYGMFEITLKYKLFRGMLFGEIIVF